MYILYSDWLFQGLNTLTTLFNAQEPSLDRERLFNDYRHKPKCRSFCSFPPPLYWAFRPRILGIFTIFQTYQFVFFWWIFIIDKPWASSMYTITAQSYWLTLSLEKNDIINLKKNNLIQTEIHGLCLSVPSASLHLGEKEQRNLTGNFNETRMSLTTPII